MIRKVEKVWLTVDEVAAILQRPSQTIYGWIDDGVIPARRIFRNGLKRPRIRINKDDAEALMTRLASGLPARA